MLVIFPQRIRYFFCRPWLMGLKYFVKLFVRFIIIVISTLPRVVSVFIVEHQFFVGILTVLTYDPQWVYRISHESFIREVSWVCLYVLRRHSVTNIASVITQVIIFLIKGEWIAPTPATPRVGSMGLVSYSINTSYTYTSYSLLVSYTSKSIYYSIFPLDFFYTIIISYFLRGINT